MATLYFTTQDLRVRLSRLACEVGEQAEKIINRLKYGERLSKKQGTRWQLLLIYMEILKEYDPITSVAQDGETNCYTEAIAEDYFEKAARLAGICFAAKNASFNDPRTADTDGTVNLDNIDVELVAGTPVQFKVRTK